MLDDRPDEAAEVPLGWLAAEETAWWLLECGDAYWPWSPFECRVTHGVLALTALLTVPMGHAGPSPGQRLPDLRRLVEDDSVWARWCEGNLASPQAEVSPADLALAVMTWHRLAQPHGLGHDADLWALAASTPSLIGLQIGVRGARRLLDDLLQRWYGQLP
ncbi:hypothetical protein [Streptomyces mirabilis]|uniref:DUF2384 domain-containing protein n=1 Tax=Streptomyces mirabilis TaxID=68239 RepID=A0ABU3V576_9ACTN|nr:hypothetical protein [Streptomyces mirabilis]MCX5355675.1 hypothetical protein [Streptomyces mirabilis]MDU9001320.1 hypothetical protein [Streptomyces mirabilis]